LVFVHGLAPWVVYWVNATLWLAHELSGRGSTESSSARSGFGWSNSVDCGEA
jgi:hypothetical protein